MSQPLTFKSDNLNLQGILHLPTSYQSGVLFHHGGGESTSVRYAPFQSAKTDFGQSIASFAIDFRGCGQSEGEFEAGSLVNRLRDAEAALKVFIDKSKLPESNIYLWGSSMGGHLACRLVEKYPNIRGLILQSAAAYSSESETLPLNAKFTQVITQPNNWVDSLAFTALEHFTGKTLVIYGEHDTVIPQGVQQKYQTIALAHGGRSILIPNSTHTLLNPQTNLQRLALSQLVAYTHQFITGT